MSNSQLFDQFTKRYSLPKTLRFELKPVGETEKFIKAKGLLKQDEERADKYEKAKDFIDEIHKAFIEQSLSNIKLKHLNEFCIEYLKPMEERNIAALEKSAQNLRKEIASVLKENPLGDEKKLVEEIVPHFLRKQGREDDAKLVESFKGFTTYFGGFNENRKNIYSDEEKATAIAFRLVNDNLPKFLSNLRIFKKLITDYPDLKKDFADVEKGMKDELGGSTLADVFSPAYYNQCLTQKGIDRYNAIIGGKTDEKGNKTQGINEKINLYKQRNNLTGKQAPTLARLFKQILSDRITVSYLPEQFKSADECINAIKEFYSRDIEGFVLNNKKVNALEKFRTLLSSMNTNNELDLNKLYIRNNFVTAVSQQMFGNFSVLTDALRYFFLQQHNPAELQETKKEKKSRRKSSSKTEEILKKYLKQSYFSIAEIETALKIYVSELDVSAKEKEEKEVFEEILKQDNPVVEYFRRLEMNVLVSNDKKEKKNVFDYFEEKRKAAEPFLNKQYEQSELISNKEAKTAIKDYLDACLNILHFAKPLYVLPPRKDDAAMPEKDNAFYNEFDELYKQIEGTILPVYNKVRSYLTQKPYSVEKFKLNFENVSLLKGWDVNKEVQNTCVLLRKDGLFYLGIMDKEHNNIFTDENIPSSNSEKEFYEKMYYKLLPGPNKMLPKVFFSEKNIQFFNPSKSLLEKYEQGTHKKGDNFSKKDCHALIDFFKSSIQKHEDWKNFNFKFSPTGSYEDMSDFYREVEQQGYKVSFKKIPARYIDDLVASGKLFLFLIYNKDFSPNSTGKPNLHTLYWKQLFSEENLKDVVFKLDGEAEVFYRPASISEKSKIVHLKNKPIENKNPLNSKGSSKFSFDITKDKRYTEDKYHFHVPITLNFKSGEIVKFNEHVNAELARCKNVCVIGIDRGVRHLAYYSVIDSEGNIIEQDSFNVIRNEYNGTTYETDYHYILSQKEKERDESRKSWESIGKIKEVKEGYLSQVVHKIAQLMVKHNAIVVFEDLNLGFKRGQMKFERQVYQKLEKMLIDKLNYLVFKDRTPNEPGGVLNAYQLAEPFKGFKYMGKQTGFIFYVQAANTSKIDPVTGFTNFIYPKYENEIQAKELIAKFTSIRYNKENDYFEFTASHNSFVKNEEAKLDRDKEWIICTYGKERWHFNTKSKTSRNVPQYLCEDVTENLKKLFVENGIQYENGVDIKNSILNSFNAKFYETLLWNLRIVLQLRYTYKDKDGEQDYILSPVAPFFDSRKADATQPQNADANGAYNIAKKGLLVLKRLRGEEGYEKYDKKGKPDLFITNKEWLEFAQNR